jgi:dolichyl-phosphate beta-glucosyltransferase
MRPSLRRLVAAGLVATVVDVGLLVLLARAGLALAPADLMALALAAWASFTLHRRVTLRDDPFVRWIDQGWLFLATVVVAGLVDVVVLCSLAGGIGADASAGRVVGPKLVAVAMAAVVRLFVHRTLTFRVIRREQDEPSLRGPAPGTYRLSVVVPAYCEQGRIGATVERLRRELDGAARDGGLEIVVVDDGSGDATAAEARAAGADRVLVLAPNRGKGAAVRAGMLAAQGRTVAFTDADLAYAPAQIVGLLERIEAGWDVVVGNRRHVATRTLVRAGRLREVGGRLVNLATHALLLGQYRDTQCGLKAFRSDVARVVFTRTFVDGFAFDVEIFHLAERLRLSLAEVPVEVENSERSTVRAARDGLRLLRDLLRVRRWAGQGRYAAGTVELPSRDLRAHGA